MTTHTRRTWRSHWLAVLVAPLFLAACGPAELDPTLYDVAFGPDVASQGDVFIATIRSDTANLLDVTDVRLYGPSAITVIAETHHSKREYLVTFKVHGPSLPGTNDLLVELADGTALFAEGALEVIGEPLPAGEGCD